MTHVARLIAAALLFGVMASLASCGTDEPGEGRDLTDSPAPSSAASPPAPIAPYSSAVSDDGPEAAYRRWLAGLAAHDAEAACAEHAPQFTIELRDAAILLHRAELGEPCVAFVAVLWEQPEREYEPTAVEVTRETDEDAELGVTFPGDDVTVTLEKRNGAWEILRETPRTGEASSGATGGAGQWIDAWCSLELGMSIDDVTDLMGEPSGTYTVANGGEPQVYWALDQYDFRAYLDADPPGGTVSGLVGDYDQLSAEDRATLTCPELRLRKLTPPGLTKAHARPRSQGPGNVRKCKDPPRASRVTNGGHL